MTEKKNGENMQQENILNQVKLVYYINKFNIFEINLLPDISYVDAK